MRVATIAMLPIFVAVFPTPALASHPVTPETYLASELRFIWVGWMTMSNDRGGAVVRVDESGMRELNDFSSFRFADMFSPARKLRWRVAYLAFETGRVVCVASLVYWLYLSMRRSRTRRQILAAAAFSLIGAMLLLPRLIGVGDLPPPSYAFLDDFEIYPQGLRSNPDELLAVERPGLRPDSPTVLGITVSGAFKEIVPGSLGRSRIESRPAWSSH